MKTFTVDKVKYKMRTLTVGDFLDINAPVEEGFWIWKKLRRPTQIEFANRYMELISKKLLTPKTDDMNVIYKASVYMIKELEEMERK